MDKVQELMQKIGESLKDSSKDKMKVLKEIVKKEVVKLGTEESRAFINVRLADKFQLTDDEIKILMDMLDKAERKEKLYEKLLDSPSFITINPSQDYSEQEGMNYTFFGGNTRYIITSKRNIFDFEECEENGIKLTNKEVSTSKLNPKAVVKYARDGMSVKALDIFLEIVELLKKYIFFEIESIYTVLVIWILHTYVYQLFLYVPYLWLNRRQGKSENL